MLLSTLIKTRLRASRLCLLICCIAMIALSIIGAIVTPLVSDYELFENVEKLFEKDYTVRMDARMLAFRWCFGYNTKSKRKGQ